MDFERLVWLSPQSTALACFGLLAAGMIGGVLATVLLRIAPAIRQLATQWAFSLWVLGSFVYAVFGGVRVSLAVHLVVIDALLAFALAIAAYRLWCELWGWLRRGQIWSVILAVVAMSAILWIPLAVYFSFIVAKRRRVMGQEAKKLSRRDLFKVGTAIAGAALLQPRWSIS